jgi:cytochrome c peroxidase
VFTTEAGALAARRRKAALYAIASLASAATVAASLVGAGVARAASTAPGQDLPFLQPFDDPGGQVQSFRTSASINVDNAFFDHSLGGNGQACVTCHEPGQGFAIGSDFIRQRFAQTDGMDPLFRVNDTANSPFADVSTLAAREAAYSRFLDLGVVRISIGVPASADFKLTIEDPVAADVFARPGVNQGKLSLFRRPLVNTNMALDSSVNWDGRTNVHELQAQAQKVVIALFCDPATFPCDTNKFGAGKPISDAQAQQIADFETNVFTAQVADNQAGDLRALGARGGPENMAGLPTNAGILPPDNTPAFPLYDAWLDPKRAGNNEARASVARGAQLFTQATCTDCHTSPNVGNNNRDSFFAYGPNDHGPSLPPEFFDNTLQLPKMAARIRELPMYCLRPISNTSTTACGQDDGDVRVTDPGRALISGKIADTGEFKPPILRDLAARAPYFHNGSAETLNDVVDFYNARLTFEQVPGFPLTPQQKADLVAFLRAL